MASRAGAIALVGATALIGIQLAVYYPQLPDTVASHFDAAGNPSGNSSKQAFLILTLCVAGVDLLLFSGMGWMLRFLPPTLINIPHRDYWLAEERRDTTKSVLASQLLWFGAVTQLFLAGLFQLTIQANLRPEARLSNTLFWVVLAGYLAFTTAWIIALYRRFPKPA